MIEYIILISRYVLLALCVIFTISVIHSFKKTRVKDSRFVRRNIRNHYNFRIQRACVYLIHTICYGVMYLHSRNIELVFLYVGQMVFFIVLQLVIDIFFDDFNKTIMYIMYFMLSIGLVFNTRLAYDKVLKQLIICIVISFVGLLVPIFMDKSKKMRDFYYLFGLLGFLALIVVYFKADYTYGAKMILDFKFISMQPSEFVKISYAIFLSGILYKYRGMKAIGISGIVTAAHIAVLVLCKDLGTSFILFVSYLLMIYVTTGRVALLAGGLVIGGLSGAIAYSIFDHVRYRIAAWLNPWIMIEGKGYQITQSLFAICSGGLFGEGIMQGSPKSIPIVEKDFIFSAICEEMGIIVAIIILILSFCLFYMAISYAKMCKDEFYKFVLVALSIIYGFQIFLSVGGAIKLIPSTGVTYPFLSNGGSSLVATVLFVYIIQGVKLNEKIED